MPDLSIQSAFREGINEIFSTMFTDNISLIRLDPTTTKNIYGEAMVKKYLEPQKVVGRVQLNIDKKEEPNLGYEIDARFTLPTKQLIALNLAYTTEENRAELRKILFKYKDDEYEVMGVEPAIFVADDWHAFTFDCVLLPKKSVG